MRGHLAGSGLDSNEAERASRPLRVAVVVTRLEGGAGVLAVRGARAMDPGACQPVIVTGTRDWLLDAGASGLEVIVEPSLRAAVTPRSDLLALRRLEMMFRERNFDVVHTHCAKAGLAAAWPRAGPGYPGSCTPSTASRSTSSSRCRVGGPMCRSSGGSAGSPTLRCAWERWWPLRRYGVS